MIKIAKFGVKCCFCRAVQKVKAIVEADPDRPLCFVCSRKAPSTDNKITGLLLVNAHIEYHVDCTSLLADIRLDLWSADELGVAWPVAEEFESLLYKHQVFSPEYVVAGVSGLPARFLLSILAALLMRQTLCCSIMTAPLIWSALLLGLRVVARSPARLPGYGATVDGAIKLFQHGG